MELGILGINNGLDQCFNVVADFTADAHEVVVISCHGVWNVRAVDVEYLFTCTGSAKVRNVVALVWLLS